MFQAVFYLPKIVRGVVYSSFRHSGLLRKGPPARHAPVLEAAVSCENQVGGNIKGRKLIMADREQGALHQEDLNVSNSKDCQSQVVMRGTFEVEQ